jgi:hypothetical protein
MRETDTNSGADSKGVVRFGRWELEGEAYLYIVVGAVLTVLAFLVTMGWGFVARLAVSVLPLLGAAGWVKFFLVGRPPHFCGDFFEGLVVGSNFNLRPQEWARAAHPRGKRGQGVSTGESQS